MPIARRLCSSSQLQQMSGERQARAEEGCLFVWVPIVWRHAKGSEVVVLIFIYPYCYFGDSAVRLDTVYTGKNIKNRAFSEEVTGTIQSSLPIHAILFIIYCIIYLFISRDSSGKRYPGTSGSLNCPETGRARLIGVSQVFLLVSA